MRKVALVFLLAVIAPSLVLAWLAVRSLNDQQLVLERQQAQLFQGVADALAQQAQALVAERQREFAQHVESFFGKEEPAAAAPRFDDFIRKQWPLAEVGFAVTLGGSVSSPSPFGGAVARQFRLENDKFLCNRESVDVFWNSPKGAINLSQLDGKVAAGAELKQQAWQLESQQPTAKSKELQQNAYVTKRAATKAEEEKPPAGEAKFRQIVGDSMEGTLSRFLQDQLKMLFWYRSARDTNLVFGAQIRLDQFFERQIKLHQPLAEDALVELLNEDGVPVASTHPGTAPPAQRRPFVFAEIGEALPHWKIAVHLLNPAQLGRAAATARLTLGLLVAVLVLAIAVGSWLIVADLQRQLTLARQKTDFVSNVSHELKTPLTSIRMFSEMLAEGRVREPEKQRQFLHVITAEAARLTRLINNVLDFARQERGEKKYTFARCDLGDVMRETVEAYRPHLEAAGFTIACEPSAAPLPVNGDRDALAQVLVNLLSNAEKYSGTGREITVQARNGSAAEVRVLDRGAGVPRGCDERIFEQFFRAEDSLASGIQGSGLGLTLARQIARAHGGDVVFERRDGGGSCFVLRVPVLTSPQ